MEWRRTRTYERLVDHRAPRPYWTAAGRRGRRTRLGGAGGLAPCGAGGGGSPDVGRLDAGARWLAASRVPFAAVAPLEARVRVGGTGKEWLPGLVCERCGCGRA